MALKNSLRPFPTPFDLHPRNVNAAKLWTEPIIRTANPNARE
jgi:hypothetical protein